MISWLWNFGDPSSGTNNTSTLQNPTHTYTFPGVYTVNVTVTNSNNCTHDTTKQITVNPKAPGDVQCICCLCRMIRLLSPTFRLPREALSLPGTGSFGDGGTSTIENPKHKYTSAGTFNVMLRVTNLVGCNDSIMIPIITRPKPIAAFTYTQASSARQDRWLFQDQSQGIGSAIVQREWIFEPGQHRP